MDKIQRIKELVNQLNIYRHEYYNLNRPSVSDSVYDSLFDELSNLEKETDFVLSNSPTQTVGVYEVKSKLQKRNHPTPLKSLDKTKSIDELNKFRNSKDIIIMLKADGLTVELNYEDGQFIGGYTRGNGESGEDISHNCRVFKNIPLTIPFKGKLRIAGEAIIHWNDFNNINSSLPEEDQYKTPRNLVSGSVRQLDSKICSKRKVYFYAFNILETIDTQTGISTLGDSKHENFKWLSELGFSVIPNLFKDMDIDEHTISYMQRQAQIFDIPIDGIVASYNSVKYSNSLGETNHHPLHSLAYKFADETEETILRNVEWNTTRSGQINPTGVFDKVILDNTEVSRASLFNLTFIKDMQLNILNRIKVSKRNMIIPYIEENLDRQEGNYIPIPTKCPSCGAKTEIRNTGTADFLYCTNDDCPAKLLDKFVHFCSRNAMNIDGLSEAGIELFINKGFLKTFDDLYKLEQYKSQIIQLEGWGIKSYNKLIQAIEKSKNVKLENFLYALGIGQLGQGGSKRLAKYFSYDFDAIINANENELMQVEDFGEITTKNVYNYFRDDKNLELVNNLLIYVDIKKPEEKKETTFKSLDNLTFVVTGNVETFKNRKELEELITSLNGKLSGSVSSKTNYLINNDITSTSGKNKKANELNIPIISEQMFNELIGR